MSTAGADHPIDRIATDDVAEAARLAAVRDAYRRTIAEIEIAPDPASPFYWRGVLRKLPGLALASTASSGARIIRAPSPDERDDLIVTVAVEGRLSVRQGERETGLRAGEMAVTRSREASRCEREAHARSIELRIPSHAVVPTARELDSIMASAISAPEPLAMLRRYVDGHLDSFGLERRRRSIWRSRTCTRSCRTSSARRATAPRSRRRAAPPPRGCAPSRPTSSRTSARASSPSCRSPSGIGSRRATCASCSKAMA